MDIYFAAFFARERELDSAERVREANPELVFDSTLKRELESLLEDARNKRESQENVENAG